VPQLPRRARDLPLPAALLFVLLALGGIAAAEVVDEPDFTVSFTGNVRPSALPRDGAQGIRVTVKGTVKPVGEGRPPSLDRFVIAFNRNARLSTRGLPVCPPGRVEAVTTEEAREACGPALVGTGHFAAHVAIPDEAPFPANGRVLVFNSSSKGRPALVAHIYGVKPLPTAQVLPIDIRHSKEQSLDVVLAATMPQVGEDWGYVTGFDLSLHRTYTFRGHRRSLASASCPAPGNLDKVPFRLARGTFELLDGSVRHRSLQSTCHVRDQRDESSGP
jgi:hypothetical protein